MLVAADVLAVWWRWLEERQLVLVCQLMKMVVVCQSAGRSSQLKSLKVLICYAGFLRLYQRQLMDD